MLKQDRTARLLRLQMILYQNPQGLEIKEISRLCSVSLRTAYRDMQALESGLKTPVWEKGNKRGINDNYFLPPIKFTLTEAMNIFLAARALSNYFHEYHPSVVSVFLQLSSIVPLSLQKKFQEIIDTIEKLPRNENKVNNLKKLTQAWLSQHCVSIKYQDTFAEKPVERVIDPYLIEPGIPECTICIIAYCHLTGTILTFNIDCIIGEVNIESDTFKISSEFDANNYISSVTQRIIRQVRENEQVIFPEITDDQWRIIRNILPLKAWTGRSRADDRNTINGILCVLGNKFRWSDLPRKYGSSSTCHRRYQTWQNNGVWDKIMQILVSTPKQSIP